MTAIRATVTYRGRVQGVGFRATAKHLAASHLVSGFVRNEPDGSVLLVAEGEGTEVEAFLDAVQDALRCQIAAADTAQGPATGEFDGFAIRR
jgi:acylphosphatase